LVTKHAGAAFQAKRSRNSVNKRSLNAMLVTECCCHKCIRRLTLKLERGLDAQPILAASPAILCRTKKEERVIHNE